MKGRDGRLGLDSTQDCHPAPLTVSTLTIHLQDGGPTQQKLFQASIQSCRGSQQVKTVEAKQSATFGLMQVATLPRFIPVLAEAGVLAPVMEMLSASLESSSSSCALSMPDVFPPWPCCIKSSIRYPQNCKVSLEFWSGVALKLACPTYRLSFFYTTDSRMCCAQQTFLST